MSMTNLGESSVRVAVGIAALLLICVGSAWALPERTQTVSLAPGWSAVWLEVEPTYGDGDEAGLPMRVEDVFVDSAITLVARPDGALGSAEFQGGRVERVFNQDGWRVWRRSGEAGADTLARVRGNAAYLIFNDGGTSVPVDVTGRVRFFVPGWAADEYLLVGFGLRSAVAFDSFFAAAGGKHPTNRIFRLLPSGNWANVAGSSLMQPGEAYWVFSDGPSGYMGPVSVGFSGTGSGVLSFGDGPGTVEVADPQGGPGDTILLSRQELVLSNVGASAQAISVTKVDPATSGGAEANDALRLYEINPVPESLDYAITGQIAEWDGGSLPGGETDVVTLGAHRNWASGARVRENLYRVEVGVQYFWFPVRAGNPDAIATDVGGADVQYAGLWVGEVLVDRVTSLVEAGRPSRATPSAAPLRVILHVDGGSGAVSLLSQVMLMQTKTADPGVDGDEVLVVDESKIPYFEGIEERGGKRVGKRIETTSYDLPRLLGRDAQVGLLGEIATLREHQTGDSVDPAELTDADVVDYVLGRETRPPALAESYATSWPLVGGLGPGLTVLTNEPFGDADGNGRWGQGEPYDDLDGSGSVSGAPLIMDAFHRSNPFRHAFHPRHVAGRVLVRSLSMTFDDEQDAGELTGFYEERVSGLAAVPLTFSGRLTLRRVSDVGELQ